MFTISVQVTDRDGRVIFTGLNHGATVKLAIEDMVELLRYAWKAFG